jgi:hypothetical protein
MVPRDWKGPLTQAAIRIIYIMEHTSGFQGAAARTLYSYLKLKIDISGLYYEALSEIKADRSNSGANSHAVSNSGANSHAVESRFDIAGKFAFEPREIEIAMKIGENRALGPQFGDPVKSFRQGQMTGVRRVAQSIDDPQVEPLQKTEALDGNGVEIGRIGDLAKPKSERANFAMFKLERNGFQRSARTNYAYRLTCYQAMFV